MKHRYCLKMVTGMLLLSCTTLTAGEIPIKNGDSIAFLGDSLTQLGNVHKPNGYIHLVIEGLKQAGVDATPIPAGIGGNTTRDMLARLDRDVISKKPTWVTVNSGINDSGKKITPEEFDKNLREITERCMKAGIKVILLTTTIGAGENIECPSSQERLEYVNSFRKLAKEKGLILVDLNKKMTETILEIRKTDQTKGLKLTYDGTHMNGLGNQMMAAEILRTLNVPEQTLAELNARWHDYPSAVGMAQVSISTYMKLKAEADKKGITVDELAAGILTDSEK